MKLHGSIGRRLWTAGLLFVGMLLVQAHGAIAQDSAFGLGMVGLAGATVDTSEIDEAMKILFEDSIVNNVIKDSELLDLFESDFNIKTEETTGGRYIETAQYFQLPSGVGARAEGEYIPVPGGPVVKNARIYLKKIQAVAEMTGDVMRRVKGDRGAFLNWAERHLPDLVERLDSECDRMTLGYGAGVKARITSIDTTTPSAPVVTLQDAMGISGLSEAWLQFLEGETNVFSATVAGTALRNAGSGQSVAVSSINQDDNKITYAAALPTGTVANDYIFAGDASGASTRTSAGDDREFMGLLGLVDDGAVIATFQNIARASYTAWQSVILDSNANGFTGTLTEELVQFADDECYVKGAGKINVFVTSRKGLRSLWKDMKADRSINDPRGAYTGGVKSIDIILGDRTVTVKVARKMPHELAFGLTTSTFKKWMLGTFQWDDTTGSIWNRVTDSTGRKDAFYAVGNMYLQLGNLAPRKNFRIEGLI